MDACKFMVHSFDSNEHVVNWAKCSKCMECVKVCESGAIVGNSKEISLSDLMLEIKKDIDFYKKSDGGVTFSGGEPMMQKEQLAEILQLCKKEQINTAIETAGNYSFEKMEPLLKWLDLIIIDLKAFSNDRHKKCTGSSNDNILQNIVKISQTNKRIWIRIPVVENVNITLDEIEKMGQFLKKLRVERVELLPYHKIGISKYKTYGLEYKLMLKDTPSEAFMLECENILCKNGVKVVRI